MELRTARTLGIALAVAMTAAIVYGMVSGGFVDELRTFLSSPWGRVTFIDLGTGLILMGSWIRVREGSTARSIPWWVALVITGNLGTAVYVANAAVRSATVDEFLTGRP